MSVRILTGDCLGLNAISIDIAPTYAAMQRERIRGDAPLLATVVSA